MTAQQLKNSILQMAVQGKLVPQDPNDEPASVLLERIRAEKEQLIKAKKIKREKNPSTIFRGADKGYYQNGAEYLLTIPQRFNDNPINSTIACGIETPKTAYKHDTRPE